MHRHTHARHAKSTFWLPSLLLALSAPLVGHADIDTTPPALLSATPANTARDIALTSTVVAHFDEALDPASITTDSLTLGCEGVPVAGSVTYSESSGPQVVFTPASVLPAFRNCTAILPDSGVRDVAQNPNAGTVVWSFRTVNLKYQLQIVKGGAGSGRIYGAATLPPATATYGIDCGSTCETRVISGRAFALEAAPARGSRFSHWVNCPAPTGLRCDIPAMTAPLRVTAYFAATGATDLYKPPYWPTAGWNTASPESQGFLPGSMANLAAEAVVALPRHTSLVVIKNGYIVHESYHAPEGVAGTIDENTKHHVWSVTKSVTALTLGRAWTKGAIQTADLDTTVDSAFSPLITDLAVDAGQRAITLRDVLEMRSGLNWNDANLYNFSVSPMFVNDPACPADADRVLCTVLHRAQTYPHGSVWNYSTMDSYLAAGFFRAITGTPLHTYAATHLFAPMGINYNDGDWFAWPPGSPNTFGGGLLYLSSRDMAKFGLLALYNGRWESSRLISKDWMSLVLAPQGSDLYATYDESGNPQPMGMLPTGNIPYGMQWWLGNVVGQANDGTFSARGLGGQLIHVFPSEELVVVVTSDSPDPANAFPPIHAFVQSAIIDRLAD